MLHVKLKGAAAPQIIPAGHDTRLSANGQVLEVIDKDGNAVAGVSFDPATVSVVVRKDDPTPATAPAPKAATPAPATPAK